jgi:diguanylate cyclase (GGDEF)-like protein
MMADSTDISPADAVRTIWEKHRESAFRRIGLIERAITGLTVAGLDEGLRDQAQRAAHMLAGSAGTFGFTRASQAARTLEEKLAAPVQAQVPRLAELVMELRHDMEGEIASPDAQPVEPDGERPRLLVVAKDRELCEHLAAEAASREMDCDTAPTVSQARELCRQHPPRIVLLDLTMPPAEAADAYELLSQLSSQTPPIPVLVRTGSDAFVDRVQAARRGGRAFLAESLAPAAVLDTVGQFLARERLSATRVLIVDDDPLVLAMMRELLERHDLEISTLTDPLLFWEKLEEVAPELLILDVDMPGVNGPELCRVVRSDSRWSGLAVIFVTAASDPATIEEIFRVGTDDYLPKPIVGPELVTRVSNRLERVRLHRAGAETDNLTGLANRAKSSDSLIRLLTLADRFAEPLSIAMLDLDHFKQINDAHGHASGDSVLRAFGERLRRDFRGEDAIGRWGGEEFVVGMYGMSGKDGARRLTDTLATFSKEEFGSSEVFQASFSAGVAEYPLDGHDLNEMLEAADRALYDAKTAGRARVLTAGHEASTELCDVLCVEDDEMQAELLLSSLATRGYTTRHLADGEQARLALCGQPPALRCRVLLLDVDLPGLDGHSLLRQLAQNDLLRSMRVIMLTARASEPETMKALELGAFDHVTKPFSLPVLLHRVQNAIET